MAISYTEDYSESLHRKQADAFDFPAMLAMLALVAIGLIAIYSATYEAEMSKFFVKQLVFAGIGLTSMIGMVFLPERWLRAVTPAMYGVAILLLIAVLVPGLGLKINGQRCWISLGGFQFQPSEFAKIATLLMVGRLMESKGVNIKTLRDFGLLCGIVFLPMLLVLAEKDTGTTSVFFAMLMGILLWGGGDLFLLFAVAALPVIGITSLYGMVNQTKLPFIAILSLCSVAALFFRRSVLSTAVVILMFVGVGFGAVYSFDKLPDHIRSRILVFFEPEKYPKDEGYHVLQSMMAVGSGGVTGKGFLHGTQTQLRYIPEQWTDFIFSVLGEEFGFIGSVTVLGLLVFLIFRIVRIARMVRNDFASIVAFGVAAVLLYHTMVNIGMAIGLFPVMGIPLPFLSSGGTALIMNMTVIGLLLNFHRQRQKMHNLV